jgi:hypothetical protein
MHTIGQKNGKWLHEDQSEHTRVGGTREEFLTKFQGSIMMGTGGRSCLVRAGYTLAMLCGVADTWNKQGNDCFGWASGISMPSGSKVTSCSNKNSSITLFFLVAYLK